MQWQEELPAPDDYPMVKLLSRIKRTITRYRLLSPGDHVVVAVSGGPDSVCLLAVLMDLSPEFDLSLHVAHLDHRFRGRESAAEARFVEELAEKLGIPATVERIDVPAYCRERGISAQAGAREVRYDFLSQVARDCRAARIATGHTANDQAETFLLRLLRGAGISGLSAIPPIRGNIVRPLLEVSREEVLEYLAVKGLSFVSDPSNEKPIYARNRVRMELLPLLKQFNPGIIETLASEAGLLRDEEEAAEECFARGAEGILEQQGGHWVINGSGFSSLPRAFQRRLILKALTLSAVPASSLSSVQIEQALGFMASAQTGRAMELPGGIVLLREYEKFLFRSAAAVPAFFQVLALPGLTDIPALGLAAETMISDKDARVPEAGNYFWQALFDYDKITPILTVRNRASGDWFCPAGMGGKRKKVQDFFVDLKVPRRKRDAVPLVLSGDDVIWIPGYRTDERFRLCAETRKVVVVRFRGAGSGKEK